MQYPRNDTKANIPSTEKRAAADFTFIQETMTPNLLTMQVYSHAKILQSEYEAEKAIERQLNDVKIEMTSANKTQLKCESLFDMLFDAATAQPKSTKNLATKADVKS